MPPVPELDYPRIVNAARLELESAGNPAYVVAVVDAAGQVQLAPMVFSNVGPAAEHAARLRRAASESGEQVLIVSRSAAAQRAMFVVLEPSTLRKLHEKLEVIEKSFAETDAPL